MTEWEKIKGIYPAAKQPRGYNRTERVADIVKNEIGTLLVSRTKDPRLAIVSIVQVIMSKDLRRARVRYSVYGNEKKAAEAEKGLTRAKGFIRSHLAKSLGLRVTPELIFERDLSMLRQQEMELLFKKLKNENEPTE